MEIRIKDVELTKCELEALESVVYALEEQLENRMIDADAWEENIEVLRGLLDGYPTKGRDMATVS